MWDVIVIGGGHAGAEAAAAAARYGAQTLLLTHRLDAIGEMSCNPAIGGLGKGHLVREIDALDGLMAKSADRSGIQFRLLNRSRGPAVRGPRAQIDRALYRQAVQDALTATANLTLKAAAVEDLIIEAGRVVGVVDAAGGAYRSAAVVLTSGTFLRGVIHRGEERIPAGRDGDAPALGLADRLYAMGLPIGRLKTGTPARLDGTSIRWAAVDRQEADVDPYPFSVLTREITAPQIACGVTETNAETHRIIAERLGESAVYGGRALGRGPRYCPSIEDKVVRFPDKTSHQIFLEPEGLQDDTVYPNGVSTSVAPQTQDAFLRTIRGLENVRILRYGYAIEYDYVDPRALTPALEVRSAPGLFLAGQINGTTGYEEAAAQGLVAGLNAARTAAGAQPAEFSRAEAYVGVMIDDLVTRGVTEPYRMFTSRAEFRLRLRADNADLRLTRLGVELGVVGSERAGHYREKVRALEAAREEARNLTLTPAEAAKYGVRVNDDGRRRAFSQLLAHPEGGFEVLKRIFPTIAQWRKDVREQLEVDAAYEGYLERQENDVVAFRRDENLRLSPDLDYRQIGGLSAECQEKLSRVRPASLGQASRIEGVTPGALTALLAHVRRRESA